MKTLIDKITKRANDSASIESRLKKLADQKTETERKRADILQAIEDARLARRETFGGDQAEVDAASKRVKAFHDDAAQLAEILEDLEAEIEATTDQFRQARDQEARADAAKRLETVAGKVEGQTADFEKAVKALAKVVNSMLAAIPSEIGIAPGHYSDRPEGRDNNPEFTDYRAMLCGREMVAAALADALAHELGELFDNWRDNGARRALHCITDPTSPQPSYSNRAGSTKPLPAAEIVKTLILDRLRERAERIKAGELEPVLDDIRERVVKMPEPDHVNVMAREHVNLIVPNEPYSPRRKMITKAMVERLPAPYAAKLLATGSFVKADSPEADKIRAEIENRDSASKRVIGGHGVYAIALTDTKDLGDPLGLLAAEQEEATRAIG